MQMILSCDYWADQPASVKSMMCSVWLIDWSSFTEHTICIKKKQESFPVGCVPRIKKKRKLSSGMCTTHTCFGSHQMSVPVSGGPQVNKFEHVSSLDHEISVPVGGSSGEQGWTGLQSRSHMSLAGGRGAETKGVLCSEAPGPQEGPVQWSSMHHGDPRGQTDIIENITFPKLREPFTVKYDCVYCKRYFWTVIMWNLNTRYFPLFSLMLRCVHTAGYSDWYRDR